ncbi:MAG: YraN family protein [Pseudomonadota bacterium]
MKPDRRKKRRRAYRSGLRGEWIAIGYYLLRGYWPLARRYKTPVGEVDLVVQRGRRIVFVEVKVRQSGSSDALAAISPKQQARISRAALHFLTIRKVPTTMDKRFDVLVIGGTLQVIHTPNAWFADI